ncbi:MAG TPA: S9 family peptidase [Gammaproteobacteria bacterium]|nr:S9 family peptidase [Gammaproteobacteria bacterium]
MRRATSLAAALGCLVTLSCAAGESALKTSPLGQAFGSPPLMWGLKLSPDGSKIVFLQALPQGVNVARLIDMTKAQAPTVVLAGRPNEFDVNWCSWATDTRLLCGIGGNAKGDLGPVPFTRLVGVDANGGNMRVLTERGAGATQYQDRVVDWLPDDPQHVLVQMPSQSGSGVGILDIGNGQMRVRTPVLDRVYTWFSDGHGAARLYQQVTQDARTWYVRDTPDAQVWKPLHETKFTDLEDGFTPVGFGENRNELLYFDSNEGRTALYAIDLEHDRQKRLVYSNPTYDVERAIGLGKFQRLVAVTYSDARTHLHFFDARIEKLEKALSEKFPGEAVSLVDEDWNQRFYIVFVGSDTDAGTFYRFDSEKLALQKITRIFPSLADRALAPMRPIRYPAEDGVQIPAYLTVPVDGGKGPFPTIVLPHGGPSARDYWEYDFLVQYLVASGYAVLQSNYRGSEGFGRAWRGDGGFRAWRRAVGDITAGADYLVREGIADPKRVCAVGWSYGGYAALMSVIEQPTRYRCVVSIAGVTNPANLSASQQRFVGGNAASEFIGDKGPEVREQGSPSARAADIKVPVLLVHAREDLNVPFVQSEDFAKRLRGANKDVKFVEYDRGDHGIRPERYRVDLLTELGEFLQQHLAPD